MGRQSFTLKWTAIGGDVLLEIPRNHLEGFYLLGIRQNLGCTSTTTTYHYSATLCDNSEKIQKYASRFNTRPT